MELIPLKKEHLSFLLEVRNDDATRHQLEDNSIFSLSECEKWFETLESPWYIILVDETKVGYIRTNGDEVGCDIHPKFRRKGYARSAYKLYLENKSYATLKVFNDNFAKNLYKQLGFVEIEGKSFIRGREYVRMVYNNIGGV